MIQRHPSNECVPAAASGVFKGVIFSQILSISALLLLYFPQWDRRGLLALCSVLNRNQGCRGQPASHGPCRL